MPFRFDAKWKSNKFEICTATIIEDLGEEVKVFLRHSEENMETVTVKKSYLENNYTCIYSGMDV